MTDIILIVGKSNRNRMILKKALSSIYSVLEADNVKSALEVLSSQCVNAVFFDMCSSEVDCFNFLKIIKSQKKYVNIPIFVLVEDDNEGLESKAISMGAVDFFTSSFNPSLLLNRVKNEFVKLRAIESAKRDSLTGAYNRFGLESNIDLSILYNGGTQKMAMCIIDIDDFKSVNDTYGHKVGDSVLCCVVDSISEVCRENDIVGRLGGDELMVVINGYNSDQNLHRIIDRILENISSNVRSLLKIELTCSMGIAVLGLHGTNRTELYINADEALYHAKRTGKNSYIIYDPRNRTICLKDGNRIVSGIPAVQMDFYNSYFGKLKEGVYAVDIVNYNILYMNESMCKIANCDYHSYFGKECYKVIWGRSEPCDFCKRSALTADEYFEDEFFDYRTSKYFFIRERLFEWDSIIANVHIVSNITSLKRVKLAKKQIYDDMANHLYKLKKIYWSYDFKEKVVRDFSNMLGGYSKEEMEGLNPFVLLDNNLIHVDYKEAYREMYKKIFDGNENVKGEFLFKKRNSNEFFKMSINYKIIKDKNKNSVMAVAVGEEIN